MIAGKKKQIRKVASMKIIDLRSDTITLPTDEMRQAMYEAEVGDDVLREDPTVNRLEEMSASIMGKEAALFATSGTMSNLLAVLSQTRPGDEILVGSEAHMLWYEVGGASTLGGVVIRTVPNEEDGRIDPAAVEQAIRPRDIHHPQTTLLCLENTHNRCGGAVLTAEYTAAVARLAHQHGFQVYLDGARIFNAAIVLGIPAAELAKPVDKMVNRLAEDHANARRLAEGLAQIPGFAVHPEKVQTNIVNFDFPLATPDFQPQAETRGVKFLYRGERSVRAVTHRMVSAADIDETLERLEKLVASGQGG